MSASPNGRRSPSWRLIVLELLLALVSFHLLLLFTFRRYPAPLSWLDGSFLVGIVTVFVLSLMRVGAGRETEKQTLPLRDRLQPGRWLHGLGRPGLILLGGLLATSYTLHGYGGRLGSDGTMFYTRSMVIDQDLDLRNEFEQFVPKKFQHIALRAEANGTSPQPPNELGPALFWLPFYTLAHLAIKIGGVFGGTIPADGYSYPYINAVCVAGLFWAFVGVILSYRLVHRYYEPELVAWGALV